MVVTFLWFILVHKPCTPFYEVGVVTLILTGRWTRMVAALILAQVKATAASDSSLGDSGPSPMPYPLVHTLLSPINQVGFATSLSLQAVLQSQQQQLLV